MSSRWYGSLQNRLEEYRRNPEPVVGMGVTELCWSDRHPYEITQVIDSRHIIVRPLAWKRKDQNGLSDCQDYEYSSDPTKPERKLFLTKQGKWRERYADRSLGCNTYILGYAERYYDYSF